MTRKDYRNEQLILQNFSYGELACADFRDTILFCCDFRGAHLYRANFSNAVLVTCNFSGACLTEADFRVRSQRTCSFGNANLDGVIWPSAPDSIGNIDCFYNARSPFLQCAINPSGSCDSCPDFEDGPSSHTID
ncbi:MAG: pentapeptide repeat-containing protein [Merismopedia sp. SIO2A8]|nr:pentapeptide repeat-containing protein [Merismopedia sp. SIO2A8]